MQAVNMSLDEILQCVGTQTLQIWMLEKKLEAISQVVARTLKQQGETGASENQESESGEQASPSEPAQAEAAGQPRPRRRRQSSKGEQAEEAKVTVLPPGEASSNGVAHPEASPA